MKILTITTHNPPINLYLIFYILQLETFFSILFSQLGTYRQILIWGIKCFLIHVNIFFKFILNLIVKTHISSATRYRESFFFRKLLKSRFACTYNSALRWHLPLQWSIIHAKWYSKSQDIAVPSSCPVHSDVFAPLSCPVFYCFKLKSYNLQYNMLGCWKEWLIDQASDVPRIFFFHNFLQNSLQKN